MATVEIVYGALRTSSGQAVGPRQVFEVKKHQDILTKYKNFGLGKIYSIKMNNKNELQGMLQNAPAGEEELQWVPSGTIRPASVLCALELRKELNIIHNDRELDRLGLSTPGGKARRTGGATATTVQRPRQQQVTTEGERRNSPRLGTLPNLAEAGRETAAPTDGAATAGDTREPGLDEEMSDESVAGGKETDHAKLLKDLKNEIMQGLEDRMVSTAHTSLQTSYLYTDILQILRCFCLDAGATGQAAAARTGW